MPGKDDVFWSFIRRTNREIESCIIMCVLRFFFSLTFFKQSLVNTMNCV